MRWRPPRVWLRASADADGGLATAAAAVLCAMETETADRWLLAATGDDAWVAVRNVCATSYRGDGLRLRIVVGDGDAGSLASSPAAKRVHVCCDDVAGADVEWWVRREGEALIVQRMDPVLTVKLSVGPIGVA